jgi:hypothetical protein
MVKLTRRPVVGSGFGPQTSRDDIEAVQPAPVDEQPAEAVDGTIDEPEPESAQPQDVTDQGDPSAGAEAEPEAAAAEPATAAQQASPETAELNVSDVPEPDAGELAVQDPGSADGNLEQAPAETSPEAEPAATAEDVPQTPPTEPEPAQDDAEPADETVTSTGGSRPAGRRSGGKRSVGWARREVDRSTLSARQRVRGAWSAAPVRFSAAVQALLTARLVDDQERTEDYRLSLNHLVSAALRQIPTDPKEAALWAQRYQDFLGTRSPATVGTKMSLETPVAEAMPRLQAQLRRDYRYGLIGHVQTWAIIELLADLDATDAGEPDTKAARRRVLERLSRTMDGS